MRNAPMLRKSRTLRKPPDLVGIYPNEPPQEAGVLNGIARKERTCPATADHVVSMVRSGGRVVRDDFAATITRMRSLFRSLTHVVAIALVVWRVTAADNPKGLKDLDSVKALSKRLMPSLVMVSTLDHAGDVETSGTGFVVDSSGIVATSLHTIPQGRDIRVSFSDGKERWVESVYAFDRPSDLALLKIAATNLTALPLGDSDELEQGEAIMAIGHPRGHTFSVVEGVVSARRDFDGFKDLIQVAMPTEQGNSGGPIVDRNGTVFGVVAMKHVYERNLGFAMPINALKPLLEKPNPIPIKRWATIGRLNDREWRTVYGARWSQHAGRIYVQSPGDSFGGRSLCISQREVPARPYEVGVWVKLDDESGAAGLAFESDGEANHYGFYPTGGNLRLTRFEGPSVWSWTILNTFPSSHYRHGDWNHLKVRVALKGIECYVNEELVYESDDIKLKNGKVGLAKFRHTKAVFRGFQVGRKIDSTGVSDSLAKSIRGELDEFKEGVFPARKLIDGLKQHGAASRTVLYDRAKELELEAARLRQLADLVHTRSVGDELVGELSKPEKEIDLFYCALLLSKNDDTNLDVSAYRQMLDVMAEEILDRLPEKASNAAKLEILNEYLFKENGFHGSRGIEYYSRKNSYMNQVLDNRQGQPITLSVLYLELARRVGIKGLSGANVDRHFMVHYLPEGKPNRLIDVFENGAVLSHAESRIRLAFEEPEPARKREIIARILRNLIAATPVEEEDRTARYFELIVEVLPESSMDRVGRASSRWQSGDIDGAKEDLVWLLEHDARGVDKRKIRSLLLDIERADRDE